MDDMFFLTLLLGCGVAIVAIYARPARRKRNALTEIAKARNGHLIRGGRHSLPSLVFQHGRIEVKVQFLVGVRNSSSRTKVVSPLKLLRPFMLRITSEHMLTRFGKILGMQDIEVGNRGFDREFRLVGSDEQLMRRFLSPDIMQALIAMGTPRPVLSISENHFEMEVSKLLNERSSLEQMLDTAMMCLDRIQKVS